MRIPDHGSRTYDSVRRDLISGFEQSYVIDLLQRHGFDLHAAAREAGMPIGRLRILVRKHTRPWFLERVRKFYGEKLDSNEAGRVADHLLRLELKAAG